MGKFNGTKISYSTTKVRKMKIAKYSKAIVAFIALAVAIANANGFAIPDATTAQISSTIILILGTFGVFQISNAAEGEKDA